MMLKHNISSFSLSQSLKWSLSSPWSPFSGPANLGTLPSLSGRAYELQTDWLPLLYKIISWVERVMLIIWLGLLTSLSHKSWLSVTDLENFSPFCACCLLNVKKCKQSSYFTRGFKFVSFNTKLSFWSLFPSEFVCRTNVSFSKRLFERFMENI